jgi:hypothetical protein
MQEDHTITQKSDSEYKSISTEILTPRTQNDQYETEQRLRTWIEESLNIKFEERHGEKPSKLSSLSKNPHKLQKEESSMFYYNLESGYVLWYNKFLLILIQQQNFG